MSSAVLLPLRSDAPGSGLPVLQRLPRPAGCDAQRTVSAAAVCHGEPAAALALRPQPRRHGRSAASGPAQGCAHHGGHVHFWKVSFVTARTSVGLRRPSKALKLQRQRSQF